MASSHHYRDLSLCNEKANPLGGSRPHQGYQRLRNDDFIPEQFEKPRHQQPIPYKSIGSAILLFFLGSLLISLAVLINLSLMPESFHESMWGFYLLGSLLFIPGAHYTYIAYQAYYETPGYTYEDIPIMD
ncbi:transmembrane protein 230-like isoform X2 [Varroa destructor]|uniref:Transmembrane protein 230 n=1 Tax=Varroa destructor TaxID=109461 RepID=A0A7M7KQ37_VARDE|nr:transmembrane protein 230-like isoform X2 [Varroa destructor]